MGKCLSSNKQRKRSFKQVNTYFKPKVNTSSLIACRVYEKSFKDITLTTHIQFQSGSIFRRIDSMRYICIGGVKNGENCFIVNIMQKTIENIVSPPMSLSFGNAIVLGVNIYVIGSLSIEAFGQEKPAPPLFYSLTEKRWAELPSMPVKVALCGSFCIDSDIYVLGGYLNYPESPGHFNEIIIFNTINQSWVRSHIKPPVFQGLPACCPLPDRQVLIIGGHDPCEKVTDEESRKTYMFDLSKFRTLADIPDIGQARFEEEPVYFEHQVFLYSDDEVMFIYNLNAKEWGYIDFDQSNSANVGNVEGYKTIRTYLYRYVPADCEIVEYNISYKTQKRTGPSSFKYSFEFTGMCLMEDGKLMFAGGIAQDDSPQKGTWTLNPKVGSTFNTADLPVAQYGLKVVEFQKTVYAFAGVESHLNLNRNFGQKYIPSEDRWMTLPPMPVTVFLPGICVFREKVFSFAGRTLDESCDKVQTFHLSSEDWEILNVTYPCPAFSLGCASVDNEIICFGGQDISGTFIPDTYLFQNGDFEAGENLPEDSQSDSLSFIDPAIVSLGKVLAVSTTGTVFSYFNSSWEIIFT
jgi:hypothetical protein